MAGTGKSTISRTVPRKYHDQNRFESKFLLLQGPEDVSHAGTFFTSIAVQLANKSSSLKSSICGTIAEHGDIASQALRDRLVLRPLFKLEADSLQSPLILVIDGLDSKCEGENDFQGILQLLAEARALGTGGVTNLHNKQT